MRELIDLFDNLNEAARGLLFRDPGDEFFQGDIKNPTAVMKFNSVEYFPSQPGAYDSYEEMAADGQELYKKYPSIVWVNKPTSRTKSFAILSFDLEDGGQAHYGKFFGEIRADMSGAWKNNELPGDWKLKKSSSLKGSYHKLKPNDLFAPGSSFSDPNEILSAISNNPKAQDLVPGMEQLISGKLPTFKGLKDMESAIRDDLGEVISPMALVLGLLKDSSATEASDDILGKGKTWSGSEIIFPAGKNNGLVDSFVRTPEGIEVGISSKGNRGATASIKNVSDGVSTAREKGMQDLLNKYRKQVELIDDIARLSSIDFPLVYGEKLGYTTSEQNNLIKSFIKNSQKALDPKQISSKDMQVFNELMSGMAASDKPNYSVGYHILAGLAKKVVEDINHDTKLSEACLKFLNVTPIMQLYLKTSIKGDDVVVTGITTTYPPHFSGRVKLDYSKVYYSTGTNGRVTFAYNGGDTKPSEPSTAAVTKPKTGLVDPETQRLDLAKLRPGKERPRRERDVEPLRARR
jgi:hypothetical protein